MRISVIIACYNAEATLGVQLQALSRQTHRGPFEVLVCDNGSTDGSRAVAESYRRVLPGLRVLDASSRRGPGHARNVGAQASTAPWLVFCDADDEVADEWLAAMAAGLRRHPFVAGRLEGLRLNGRSARSGRHLQQDTELQTSPFGPGLPHAGAGNLGVHREAFLEVGGFDPSVGCLEDTDLCWRLQLAGVGLTFLPEAVVHVRLRSTLRTMWAQGRDYGAAAALLEHRFGTSTGTSTGTGTGRDAAPSTRGRLPGRVLRIVGGQRSLGGLLWQLGWHAGHRRAPQPTASSSGSRVTSQA